MKEDLLKKLIASIKCGSCGQYYDESHIEVIERSEELWFLKVVCSSCHVHCMVAAIIREDNKPQIIMTLPKKSLISSGTWTMSGMKTCWRCMISLRTSMAISRVFSGRTNRNYSSFKLGEKSGNPVSTGFFCLIRGDVTALSSG